MLDRFVSQLLPLSAAIRAGDYTRIDLVLHGVDHSKASYEGRLYVNAPDADASTGRGHSAYAGSYHVLGHGECFGDIGHCDIPTGPRAPFDLRPPHQLTPHTKVVIVTDSLRRIIAAESATEAVTLTVVPVALAGVGNALLSFRELRLLSYQ
jgi:hypothetical protein